MSANHGEFKILKSCSSRKVSLIGIDSKDSSQTSLDKWSATTFSTPFLSQMVMANSWSKIIHWINLGLASFLGRRYFKAAWSLKTTVGEPTIGKQLVQCKYYSN